MLDALEAIIMSPNSIYQFVDTEIVHPVRHDTSVDCPQAPASILVGKPLSYRCGWHPHLFPTGSTRVQVVDLADHVLMSIDIYYLIIKFAFLFINIKNTFIIFLDFYFFIYTLIK